MNYLEKAQKVIRAEVQELQRLEGRLGVAFEEAVDVLKKTLENRGKIVVVGIGKSDNIGHKIAATLNSTGATAVVLNSQNALHGDLGLVASGDAVIALSYKGETRELLDLLPHLRRRASTVIAVTGDPGSTLGQNSDIVLDANVESEACPMNLAPTSSSTVMLVLGDALAMVLLEARGFAAEDFAKLHPGGSLGRALLTKVSHIMRADDRFPVVSREATVCEALAAMSRCRSGAVVVAGAARELEGIFTQGDFARAFQQDDAIATRKVSELMTPDPVSISGDRLAAEVFQLLETYPIDDLVVVDAAGCAIGLIDIQDLSRLRVI